MSRQTSPFPLPGSADAPVNRHDRQRNTRQPGLAFVGRDVTGVETVKLQQPDVCPAPVSDVPGT